MKPVFVSTRGEDEFVVLSRREYDVLLARLGDEEAEDRMTARMAEDHLAAYDENAALIPAWFALAAVERGSPLAAARRHAGLTQSALAERLGLAQGYVADLERGRRTGTPETLARIAAATGVEPAWLDI